MLWRSHHTCFAKSASLNNTRFLKPIPPSSFGLYNSSPFNPDNDIFDRSAQGANKAHSIIGFVSVTFNTFIRDSSKGVTIPLLIEWGRLTIQCPFWRLNCSKTTPKICVESIHMPVHGNCWKNWFCISYKTHSGSNTGIYFIHVR